MRAFAGRPADRRPTVRVCDADRDRVIAELRDRFADGFLSHESFEFRVDAVLRARWHDDLAGVLADLPAPRPSPAQAALGRLAQARRAARAGRVPAATAVGGAHAPVRHQGQLHDRP